MLISTRIGQMSLDDAFCSFYEHGLEVQTEEDLKALKAHFSEYDFAKLTESQQEEYYLLNWKMEHTIFSRDS